MLKSPRKPLAMFLIYRQMRDHDLGDVLAPPNEPAYLVQERLRAASYQLLLVTTAALSDGDDHGY